MLFIVILCYCMLLSDHCYRIVILLLYDMLPWAMTRPPLSCIVNASDAIYGAIQQIMIRVYDHSAILRQRDTATHAHHTHITRTSQHAYEHVYLLHFIGQREYGYPKPSKSLPPFTTGEL